jgi:hypothetical protein
MSQNAHFLEWEGTRQEAKHFRVLCEQYWKGYQATYTPGDILDALSQQRPLSCHSLQRQAQTLPRELKGQQLLDPIVVDNDELPKVICLRRGHSLLVLPPNLPTLN